MPTRADLDAATPRCPQRTMIAQRLAACDQPLTFAPPRSPRGDPGAGAWVCPDHGVVASARDLVARQAGDEDALAADGMQR